MMLYNPWYLAFILFESFNSPTCTYHTFLHTQENTKQDGCSNDDQIVEAWLNVNLKSQMLHPTSKACCDKFFPPPQKCVIYDCNGDGGGSDSEPPPAPTPAAGPVCEAPGWHVVSVLLIE